MPNTLNRIALSIIPIPSILLKKGKLCEKLTVIFTYPNCNAKNYLEIQ